MRAKSGLKKYSSLTSLSTVLIVTFVVVLQSGIGVQAWDNAEYEMYDLVEELGGKNFYEVLGITPEATDKEIRQAYRKLSIKLHPDKNPAEDAATQFRQLVGIYEVLKNKELRESYERVLVEGLPNWRQPIFYFRRARKFALWQVAVIVLTIVSVGQYLAGWASYFEKKLSMKEIVEARLRKTQRTKRAQKVGPTAEELEAEFEKQLSKPSLWNLAPFQICRGVKYLIFTFPKDILAYREELKLQKEEEAEELRLEEERLEQERLIAEEPKKPRKRKTFKVPEKPEGDGEETQAVWSAAEDAAASATFKPSKKTVISGGLWTDDDIGELAKLCNKFPGGTPKRWETIAEVLNRPVAEVTFMAKKVLEKLANRAVEEEQEAAAAQLKVKVKTKGGKADSILAASTDNRSVENWSADEHKSLENALQCYPKGSIDRWEKIAIMVPTRSKDECMLRFKYVADLVKKKKEPKPVDVDQKGVDEENSSAALTQTGAAGAEDSAGKKKKTTNPSTEASLAQQVEPRKSVKKEETSAPPPQAVVDEEDDEEFQRAPSKNKKKNKKAKPEPQSQPTKENIVEHEHESLAPAPVPVEVAQTSPASNKRSASKTKKETPATANSPSKIAEPEPEPKVLTPPVPKNIEAERAPYSKPSKNGPAVSVPVTDPPGPTPVQISSAVEIPLSWSSRTTTHKNVSSRPPASEPAPAPDLVEIDSVAAQLHALVDECESSSLLTSSTTSTEVLPEKTTKAAVQRTDSKSSDESSEPALVVVHRGSKASSVERKHSSSSNNSETENDWCVIDESENLH